MNRKSWAWGLSGVCILALASAWVMAQEKKPAAEPKKGEPAKKAEDPKKPAAPGAKAEPAKGEPAAGGMNEEMMKKMMELCSPGEAHKQLNFMVGKWDYEIHWQMTPDAPVKTSKGAAEMKSILDGRVIQQDCSGPPDEPSMPPFKGLGLYGYDNMKKEYWCLWMDNMGTGVMLGTGTYDAATKTFATSGEMADPMTGNAHEKYRSTTKTDGDSKIVYDFFMNQADGKEFRCMEIVYTRAK